MHLRRRCAAFFASLGIALLATPTLAQEDFSKVKIETVPVAEGVYMLVGAGGNIGVSAGEDGVFLIDDQFAPLTWKIRAAVGALSKQPIRFVLNTHWHFDHTGGNENLGKMGAVIVAHDNVRKRMSVDQFLEALQREIKAAPPVALPVVTFNDTLTLHLNDQTIHAFHVDPAHTDGDSVVHFREANVIHAGDTYFNGLYPFIDTQNGGSIEGMIAAVDRILALADDDTKIIPGHGPLSNKAELQVYRQMLVAVRDRTRSAIKRGQSLEAFLASNPTADLDPTWGNGFLMPAQFLTIVYTDLAR